jgi:YD repeat-containing protein
MNFFDEQGAPTVAARLGSAKRRWSYDAAGRVSERSDHDMNGRPIINAYGYSILRHRYDEHGRDAGRELLDTTGRALVFKVSVDRVAPGSVAADAGLKVGDLILTYDGQSVSTIDQFTNTFELFRGDRGRELRIERAGNVLSLDVPPGRLEGLELAERVPAATSAQR